MNELNAWIASVVDALAVIASDSNAIGGGVARCKQKGIVFIGYANVIDCPGLGEPRR